MGKFFVSSSMIVWDFVTIAILVFISTPLFIAFRTTFVDERWKKNTPERKIKYRMGFLLIACVLPLSCILVGFIIEYPKYLPILKTEQDVAQSFKACEQSQSKHEFADHISGNIIYYVDTGYWRETGFRGVETLGQERNLGFLHNQNPNITLDKADTIVCVYYHYPSSPSRMRSLYDSRFPGANKVDELPIYDPTVDIIIVDWPSGKLIKASNSVDAALRPICSSNIYDDPTIIANFVNNAIGRDVFR